MRSGGRNVWTRWPPSPRESHFAGPPVRAIPPLRRKSAARLRVRCSCYSAGCCRPRRPDDRRGVRAPWPSPRRWQSACRERGAWPDARSCRTGRLPSGPWSGREERSSRRGVLRSATRRGSRPRSRHRIVRWPWEDPALPPGWNIAGRRSPPSRWNVRPVRNHQCVVPGWSRSGCSRV